MDINSFYSFNISCIIEISSINIKSLKILNCWEILSLTCHTWFWVDIQSMCLFSCLIKNRITTIQKIQVLTIC